MRALALSCVLLVGCALAAVGVFTRWTSGDGVTLNGIQGPHNGWIILVGRYQIHPRHAERVVHRRHATKLLPSRLAMCNAKAANLSESGCLPRFLLEPVQ